MNRKLKAALRDRGSEQGFALPLAVGMGMIMILVGMTMVIRSQGDQMTASAQKATARSLGTAETGVTRVQSLLSKYPELAKTDLKKTDPLSWQQAYKGSPGAACTGEAGASEIDNYSLDKEVPLNNGDQFKIVGYDFEPTNSPIDPALIVIGVGTLITIPAVIQPVTLVILPLDYLRNGESVKGFIQGVEGTLTRTGVYTFTRQVSGAVVSINLFDTFVPSNPRLGIGTLEVEGQHKGSKSRLEVEIPVVPLNTQVPGLWVQNVAQNMGKNQVDGNILVSGGCTLPAGMSNSNVTKGHQVLADPYSIPETPALPNSNLNEISTGDMDNRIWGQTLPKVGDRAQPDGSYHYQILGDLAKNGNANITLSPGAKVVLYVRGNIDISGGSVINQNGYPQNMKIYGNTYTDLLLTTKYGCTVTILGVLGNCPTRSLKINGEAAINALIHAPEAVGGVAVEGGGCNTSTNPPSGSGFIGAVWIKKWDKQSDNTGPMICAYGKHSDYLKLSDQNQKQRSMIAPISSWQRKEAQ